jgi:hypothetical protein
MPDVKISDATPVVELFANDVVPIARVGIDAPLNASLDVFATYVTVLASSHPPEMSDQPPSAGKMEQYARADHIHPTDASRAPINSPQFTGSPTAPSMLPSDSSDAIATTKFVHDLARSGTLRTDTPAIDDNSELVATTEYVQNQGSTQPPLMNGTPTAGVSQRFARGDHTHPVDTSRYAASNPSGFQTAAQVTAVVPVASSTPPAMDGTVAVGTGTTWARADHVHPVDTSRYAANNPAGYQTQAQVRAGTTTNDNAAAGQIGEFISASVASPGVTTSNAVALNVTTISLTAGDWDVQGQVGTIPASGTKISDISVWPSTTSAAYPATLQGGLQRTNGLTTQGGDVIVLTTGRMRLSLAATATVYLSAMVTFAGGTLSCTGFIGARRMR